MLPMMRTSVSKACAARPLPGAAPHSHSAAAAVHYILTKSVPSPCLAMAGTDPSAPTWSMWPQQTGDALWLQRGVNLYQIPMITVCCCTTRNWDAPIAGCVRRLVS
jgi:hypothetical protein